MKNCEKWTIAYRRRQMDGTLLDDTKRPFLPVPNSWRYWCADPFLVEEDGHCWLFAELYDRVRLKGILGCCELTDDGPTAWKIILDEPFHLSYPFVFRGEDGWYMIPEAFNSGKLMLYKATSFPWSWEQTAQLADMAAVDSTLVDAPTGQYLISVRVIDRVGELVLMKVGQQFSLSEPRPISEKEDPNVRPAGRAFYAQDKLIRPAQDCTKGYGYGLNFMQVHQLDDRCYSESLLCKILPKDLTITGVAHPEGIHTYNFSDHYEVIDYKEYEFALISKIAGVVKRIKKRLHRA